jgi:type II secretory pathway component GspD/PulD (secretin)
LSGFCETDNNPAKGMTLKNSTHTRPTPWLITAMALLLALLTAGRLAAAPYTYGPVIILFPKGSAELTNPGLEQIQELAALLRGKEVRAIRIAGFSDSVQVSAKNPFADNQALTLARAEKVCRALQAESGLGPEIFTATGNGAAGEVAANDTAQGQAMNRRVEIRVEIEDQAPSATASATSPATPAKIEERITLSMRQAEIAEVFEMLSKKHRTNIVVEKDVAGLVSVNLYEVTLDEAITTIAASAGYDALKSTFGYRISQRPPPGPAVEPLVATEIRTYPVQYAEPEKVEAILTKHLSKYGKATALQDRGMVVIEDTPPILEKLGLLLKEIDREPRQILIEAKILEITLDESESFGLNWWKIFTSSDKLLHADDNGLSLAGVQGLSKSTSGFIFNLVNKNVNITLDALNQRGKVKTLSTPKIMSIENQESSVIIGDRKGYTVTTTINTVTTTSVQFLESGVILKVTPSVDGANRILLKIHPEVSSGSVTANIPSQTTTEVSTSLLADNGQTIFIGGLLKKKSEITKDGVPVLEDIPVLGHAFSNSQDIQQNTETVVLITPYLISQASAPLMAPEINKVERASQGIDQDQAGTVPAAGTH